MVARSKVRVLHCPTMTGGNPQELARAERELGLDSHDAVFEQAWFEFETDEIVFDPSDSFLRRECKRFTFLKRAILDFDVIHFNFGRSILFEKDTPTSSANSRMGLALRENLRAKYFGWINLKDLPLLKRLGKGIVVTYQGDDARQQDFCLDHFETTHAREASPGHFTPATDASKRAQISVFDRYADSIYALNPDLLWVLPERAQFMPYASVDPRKWEFQDPNPTDRPPLILHAPSDRGIKGTKYVEDAVARLRVEGYRFEFQLVHGLPHREARRFYERADLLIDQVLAGWYGALAVELMALGKPAICYMRENDFRFLPDQMREELPLINARPDTLYDVLRTWITTRRAEIPERGQRCRAFVKRWHDPVRIAANLARDYGDIVERNRTVSQWGWRPLPTKAKKRDDRGRSAGTRVPKWNRRIDSQADRPRVLVVSHLFPNEDNLLLGSFVHEQVKALRKRGIDARVVSGRRKWLGLRSPGNSVALLREYYRASMEGWVDLDDVPVFYFPFLTGSFISSSLVPVSYDLGLRRHAKQIRRTFAFDIVHAHTAFLDGFAAVSLAAAWGTPFVLTEHTGPFSTILRTPAIQRRTETALKAADRVLAVSTSLKNDIESGISPGLDVQIEVCPNGVDLELFRPGEPCGCGQHVHALWIGRADPIKRIDRLINAFEMAVTQEPSLRLSLIGPGIADSEAVQLVRAANMGGHITLENGLDRRALALRMRQYDFVVISSDVETFGMVAIEAMACGIPVLATNCGGPTDLIKAPELGRIVERTEHALAEGMVEAARRVSSVDSTLIRKHAEAHFSLDIVAERLERVYAGLIAAT